MNLPISHIYLEWSNSVYACCLDIYLVYFVRIWIHLFKKLFGVYIILVHNTRAAEPARGRHSHGTTLRPRRRWTGWAVCSQSNAGARARLRAFGQIIASARPGSPRKEIHHAFGRQLLSFRPGHDRNRQRERSHGACTQWLYMLQRQFYRANSPICKLLLSTLAPLRAGFSSTRS